MRRKSFTGVTVNHTLSLIVTGGLCLGYSLDDVHAAEPPQSYSRAPMAAYNFMMQDPLLGNSYEKPVWNLHDTLSLPEWLSVGVEQRTRYESVSDTFKASQPAPAPKVGGGDQQIALQSDLWIQAKLGKFRFAAEFMDARQRSRMTAPITRRILPITLRSIPWISLKATCHGPIKTCFSAEKGLKSKRDVKPWIWVAED